VAERTWGYWTEHKLEMLKEYLHAFTTASARAGATIYLDLFAGAAQNKSRSTDDLIDGSPRIALSTDPPFTKVMLFELPAQATALDTALRADFPGRDLTVWEGDCNRMIDPALAALAALNYAATFALIDQYTAEVEWETLEKLAAFKANRKYKVELWLLFGDGMVPRGLAADTPQAARAFEERVTALYGTDAWKPIYAARRSQQLDGAGLRDELVNLMRWRLENVLGYARTHTFAMKNTNGGPLYTMIFATDNATGDKIMADIYGKAAKKRPLMQAEARALAKAKRERDGKEPEGLFPPPVRDVPVGDLYQHEPPWPPYGTQDSTS